MTTEARKRLFVHKAIQGSLITRFAIHWIMFTCISCVLLVSLQILFAISQPPGIRYQQVQLTVVTFGIVSLALIPVFTIDLIRLSNRFVGPIVRMQNYLKLLDPSEVKPLKTRKSDYWQDLVEDMNSAVGRLRSKSNQSWMSSRPTSVSDTYVMDTVQFTEDE